METRKLKVIYHEDKDILSLIIPPLRPSRTEGDENDFLILRDWDNRGEIVGFEVLDFSLFVPRIYDLDALPQIELRFDVDGTEMRGVTLREVLEWAYKNFIVMRLPFVREEIRGRSAV
jgi:hypothetical protein